VAKIICPNTDYTGVSATVQFINGVGEASDPHLVAWFRENGYTVEDEEEAPKKKPRKTRVGEEVSEDDGVAIS